LRVNIWYIHVDLVLAVVCGHPSCLACAIRDTSLPPTCQYTSGDSTAHSLVCRLYSFRVSISHPGSLPPRKTRLPQNYVSGGLRGEYLRLPCVSFLPCALTSPYAQSRCVPPSTPYTGGFLLHCSLSASYTAVLTPSRRAILPFFARLPLLFPRHLTRRPDPSKRHTLLTPPISPHAHLSVTVRAGNPTRGG
jgi:hypothetical protein